MKQLAITLCAIFLLSIAPKSAMAAASWDPVKAFSQLQGQSGKLMEQVKPWSDMMKKNDAMIPASIRPQYDTFNKLLGSVDGQMSTLAKDPKQLTESGFKALSGDMDSLGKQFGDLQGMTKDLPFMMAK